MDILNKIFPRRRQTDRLQKSSSKCQSFQISEGNPASSFRLRKDDVRVLVYRDCDRRGRKLLYDSQTVCRVPIPDNPSSSSSSGKTSRSSRDPRKSAEGNLTYAAPSGGDCSPGARRFGISIKGGPGAAEAKSSVTESFAEIRNGFGYQYQKEASDTKNIGELLFGAVALAYRGSSSKLHIMKKPSCFLLSRISPAPFTYKSAQGSCDTGIDDSYSSLSTTSTSKSDTQDWSQNKSFLKLSWPVDVSTGMTACHSEEDSGFSASPSTFSTLGSFLSPMSLPCTPSGTPSSNSGSGNSLKNSGSLSGLQRRFLRNVTTSLDSFAIFSGDDEQKDDTSQSYQTKIGVTVMFNIQQDSDARNRNVEEWWFTHMESIDSSFNKLHSTVVSAYLHRSTFVSVVYMSIEQFQQEIYDLVHAPRLSDPLWLTLLTTGSESVEDKLFDRFTQSLSYLLSHCDTKHTNFFMSKLLTAVLTHHLGWVSTVTPASSSDAEVSEGREHSKFMLNLVNCFPEMQPYNALWGQLCELSGTVGNPSRAARTILVGQDRTVLNHLLVLLSYIIRCSQVIKKSFGTVRHPNEIDPSATSTLHSSRPSSASIATINDPSALSQELPRLRAHSVKCSKDKRHSWRRSADCWQLLTESSSNKGRECKWTLDNDDAIVIGTDADDFTLIDFKSKESCKHSIKVPQLTISKTASDLSALLETDPYELSNQSVTRSLYPNLTEMEDHRETFGPKDIQPEIVAEKVKKLIRVSSIPSRKEFKHKTSNSFYKKSSNKVLFTLGDGEEALGFKSASTHEKDLFDDKFRRSDGGAKHRMSVPECPINALPPPIDTRRINHMRAQGRESTNDICHYPPLDELKKDLFTFSVDLSNVAIPKKIHARNKSDPTNGAALHGMRPYFEALGRVPEEGMEKDSKKEKDDNKTDDSIEVIECESIKVVGQKSGSLKLAESLLGGILDTYSSVFVLHATTQTSQWEDQLRSDLLSAAQQPILDPQTNEAIAIVAQVDKWEVEVVSSHSYAVDRRSVKAKGSMSFGGIPVMMSPLVSQITDSLLNLIKLGSPSHFVVQCFENQLREVYLKSHLLSSYLLDEAEFSHNNKFHNLSELSSALNVDLNDIPLLLSVASTHTPVLTQKFGVALK